MISEFSLPKLKGFPTRHAVLLTWLGSFWLVWLAVRLLPLSYGEADDPAMVDLLQANFHVPFATLIFSRILGGLYQLRHDIPWYALYHYTGLAACLALSLSLIRSQPIATRWKIILCAAFAVTFLGFVTRITFTYTAVLMCGLAVVYMARQWIEGSRDILPALGSGILLLLAFLSRWESLKCIAFFLPILVFALWHLWRRKRDFLSAQTFGPLLLCYVLPLCLVLNIERMSIPMTPAEQHFSQFMLYHEDNIGFAISDFRQHPEVLQRIGWTPQDYQMYEHWLYLDEQKFSIPAVRQLSEATRPRVLQVMLEQLSPGNWGHLLYDVANDVWFKYRQFSFLILAMALLVIRLSTRHTTRWWAAGYVVLIFLASVLISVFLRFPLRVAAPIFYITALGFWCLPNLRLMSGEGQTQIKEKLVPVVPQGIFACLLNVLIVALLIVPVGETIYQTWQIVGKKADFQINYNYLAERTRGGYLLRESGLLSLKWLDPLQAQPPLFPEVSAGWSIFSVPYYMRLQKIGLTRAAEVLPWMVNRPNALLLIGKEQAAILPKYVKQTYGIDIQVLPAGHLPAPPNSPLYRLTTLPKASP